MDALSFIVFEDLPTSAEERCARSFKEDSAAALRNPDPGGCRIKDYRQRNRPRDAQRRPRQVLRRRRYFLKEEAAGVRSMEGKMRQVENVEIPQKAFMSVLKLDEN